MLLRPILASSCQHPRRLAPRAPLRQNAMAWARQWNSLCSGAFPILDDMAAAVEMRVAGNCSAELERLATYREWRHLSPSFANENWRLASS